MHVVAVLALPQTISFDLSTPSLVFGLARRDGEPLYSVRVCLAEPEVAVSGSLYTEDFLTVRSAWTLQDARDADTVLVPGSARYTDPLPAEVRDVLREAHERGARIAAIGVGTFTLAEAGLLDGVSATTHWSHLDELSARHPGLRLEPSVLYVEDGRIATSAGLAGGLDLCLQLVRRDFGAAVAIAVARKMVMPPRRDGGQTQYIEHGEPESTEGSLQHVVTWMVENMRYPLTLADIAKYAAMSPRTLNRRFHTEIGSTPLQWLRTKRVMMAQRLLETTDLSVEQIADRTGFGSALNFRKHFARSVGATPQTYRRTFGRTGD
ncbi:GlxA family transcriptional regulator [Nocardia sp. NPDC020380]|uniref:GlxA family transcriptional regulator n=1 Tax=Nocardia sp. NPDC020380 TaxID=3364309 RepID=UPI003789EEBD